MQGHIRRRGKNSWGIVISLGRDPVSGKRRQLTRSVKGRKADAERLLVELLHQKETGIDQLPGKVTVGEFLLKWLAVHAEPNTAPKTLARYSALVRVHLQPVLGQVPLAKLRPFHIQQAYALMRDQGASDHTVLYSHRVLRKALKHAVQWQYISQNPTDAISVSIPSKREFPALSVEQIQSLLEVADKTTYDDLIYLALMSGLRRGELFGLKWADIDFDVGSLAVRRTCQWLPDVGFHFKEPKTHRSARAVDLSPATVARLRQHRLAQVEQRLAVGAAYAGDDLVFADEIGRPIYEARLRTAWLLIVEEAGLPGLRFHDLRHQHASLLLKQGTHIKIVQERLGHANLSTTSDLYSHVLPGLQREAVSKLDELLANG